MPPSSSPPIGPNWDARNFAVALLGLVVAVAAIVVSIVLAREGSGHDPSAGPPAATRAAEPPQAGEPTIGPHVADPQPGGAVTAPQVVPHRLTAAPVPQPAPADDAGTPSAGAPLVGSWSGGGNPSGDQYYESLEVTFTADGAYSMTRAGLSPDTGRYEADGPDIVFRPDSGAQSYVMGWQLGRFAGRPELRLLQQGGYVSTLDKVA